ncbi:MAG: GFA family protein [Pseudomonadota bacterium]
MLLTGRCLCGAVTYEGAGDVRGVEVCHCTDCRRWMGGPFLGVHLERLTVKGPVRWFDSSEWAERGSCESCGSALFWRLKNGSAPTVTAGSLDDQSILKGVEAHIFVDHWPDHYAFADDAPRKTGTEAIAEAMAALTNGKD